MLSIIPNVNDELIQKQKQKKTNKPDARNFYIFICRYFIFCVCVKTIYNNNNNNKFEFGGCTRAADFSCVLKTFHVKYLNQIIVVIISEKYHCNSPFWI